MKKYLGLFVALFALLFFVPEVNAAAPNWFLNAPGAIVFTCSGNPYNHTLNTVSENYGTGDFTGTGSYDANNSYTWDINGNISGDSITFTLVYTGLNPGYTLHGDGTIAPDGSISGTTDGNCQAFSMPEGTASTINYTLNWGSQVNPSMCSGKVGSPVINITEKITNDIDSGFFGNWAFDNNNRQIQVWKTDASENSYCAVVRYEGKFSAPEGAPSPQTGVTLTNDVNGTFQGGYRATFEGTLAPEVKTKGSIGTIDYACEALDSTGCNRVNWLSEYFPGYSGFTYGWWGWIYHGGSHGTWINSSIGSFGDIQ